MSASGGFFSFGRKNNEDDHTPEPTSSIGATYGNTLDPNTPGTNTVFTPSTPRHAATSPDSPDDTESEETGVVDEQTERDKAMDLARHMSLPFVDLDEYQVDPSVVNMVPDDLCRRSKLLPISIINGRLALAMAKPNDFAAIDDISASTGMQVIPMVATASQVQAAISRFLRANAELNEISHEVAASAKKIVDTSNDEEEDVSPVARFVNLLINQAIDDNCSDIHIEPQEDGLEVRYRIDGVLHVFQKAPKAMIQGVISRIKVMADLDIGERRKPQDGRITVRHAGKSVDLRVATLPTVWGETVVMRILSTPAGNLKVEDLNFSKRNFEVFQKAYSRPYGMVLVTGPTGSGKSTTLYATLGDVAKPEINIITVEDPVEFRMRGINQVQVNNKAGLTFAAALRSILRADPDVVLIGEIRDQETATIAIEASLTGHLVLSTLHTNDAPSAVTRLSEMGVEPFLVSSSLAAVMAQRLARRLCKRCRKEDKATPAELAMMGIPYKPGDELPTVWRPVGCRECSNTGYKGRVAIQQVMGVDTTMEELIAKGATSLEIEEAAKANGMTSLREDGWAKALAGITSVEEVLRVTV
ncbi:GspE/PulE family protein [Bifidobacterium boum]|uniref:GspE/PulE family protein n=1 Tax=Bifidobacterium boum TaxID=78343 RepID=UPI001F4479F4|nr:GspE/PulE family protein [Bifidobacterium boum]